MLKASSSYGAESWKKKVSKEVEEVKVRAKGNMEARMLKGDHFFIELEGIYSGGFVIGGVVIIAHEKDVCHITHFVIPSKWQFMVVTFRWNLVAQESCSR